MDSQPKWADQRDYKPKFIAWYERDFREDRIVQRMTPRQRAFYRNLLMDCYYGDDRPFLTADDNLLWIIAEADSLEDWTVNKSLIMSKFKPVNGGLLGNKRVLLEWDIQLENLKQRRSAGLASAMKRRARDNASLSNAPEERTEPNITEPNPTQPNLRALNARSTTVERSLEEEARPPALPKEQDQNPKTNLLERMAKGYAAVHDGFLSLAGKPKILDLSNKHGEETVERVWDHWLNERNLEGLDCPLIAFADEFSFVLDAMQKEESYYQVRRLNAEAEMEAKVTDWCELLHAAAVMPIEGCERGTEQWEYELCEWAKRVSPPVPNLQSLDWRADETLAMEIEHGKDHYERVHNPSRRDALVSFGVLTQQQADALAAEQARLESLGIGAG
jgi:hypothetical protein